MATPQPQRVATVVHRAFRPELDTRGLPAGICGRIRGVALVYEVEDAYGTRFARGCLERTKREKLAAGKVQLFVDHQYGIRTHVGTVRALRTVGDEEMLEADIFDTEDGRHAKEYVEAVVASEGYTGFSVGFFNRSLDMMSDTFTEVELDEVSITPRPAVPGADVQGVRADLAAAWRLFEAALAVLPLEEVQAHLATRAGAMKGDDKGADSTEAGHTPAAGGDAAPADSPPEGLKAPATWEDRRAALAALYATELFV